MKMAQRLRLGETCLDEYISEPVKSEEARKKEIDELIEQLEGNVLNVEQLPLKLLKMQRAQYPRIDPSFLTMHDFVDHEGHKIQMPKFSVYKRTKEGFDDFSIRIEAGPFYKFTTGKNIYRRVERVLDDKCNLSICINGNGEGAIIHPSLKRPLFKSLVFCDFLKTAGDIDDYNGYLFKVPISIGEKYFTEGGCAYKFKTSFAGILPQKTKEKLKEAGTIFDGELYLIAETKPEDWAVTEVKRDPLLIGIFKDKCYLVDHFNPTPIENYVSKEFTFN